MPFAIFATFPPPTEFIAALNFIWPRLIPYGCCPVYIEERHLPLSLSSSDIFKSIKNRLPVATLGIKSPRNMVSLSDRTWAACGYA